MGSPDLSTSVGAHGQGTPEDPGPSPTRGALVRLGGDLELVAVDVLDRLGPRRAGQLAEHLVKLAREVAR